MEVLEPTAALQAKLLSSWIDSERPAGRPQHSWGRSMINDLPRFGLDITRDGWAASVAQDRIKWNWIVRNVTRSDQPPASTYASVMAAAAGGIGTQVSVVIFDTASNNAAPTVTVCTESTTRDTSSVPDSQSTPPWPSILSSISPSPATPPPSSSSSPTPLQHPCLHPSPPRSHHPAEPVLLRLRRSTVTAVSHLSLSVEALSNPPPHPTYPRPAPPPVPS